LTRTTSNKYIEIDLINFDLEIFEQLMIEMK
jgi:hypothetical protein